MQNKLSTIARTSRAFGIHLILATQRPDAEILGGQIRTNISYKICGRADETLSRIILGDSSAADEIAADECGRFILNNGKEKILFQSYWINEEEI